MILQADPLISKAILAYLLLLDGLGGTVENALGQLPNAPLIYVLAQIRFTHVPRMDKRWEDFHEKIFDQYPKAETERMQQVAIKDGQPSIGDSIQRWLLFNESNSTGIILDAGMLVFHSTEYKTSGDFLKELQNILDAFAQVLPERGVSVLRLGLRYVDLLVEEQGLTVDQQVMDTLRLPQIPDGIGTPNSMEQVVTYVTPIGGTLRVRHKQSTTPDVLPGDIFPNPLKPAPRLMREHPENTVVGLLDYDHYIEQEQPLDHTAIIDDFRALHEKSSAAFRVTTTSDARTIWEKEIQ